MAKILLVEDDKLTAEQAGKWLSKADGHTVDTIDDGRETLDRLRLYSYDLLILDWQLPGLSGVEICREFRASGGRAPVLLLTAKATIGDKEIAFNVGADDYLTKPFDLKELSLRVRALLRRPADLKEDFVEVGGIRLDRSTRQVFKKGAIVNLTGREYALLELLMKHKNCSLTAEEIVNKAWSSESEVSPLTVKTVISRLRGKLVDDGEQSIIHNDTGRGYCVREPGGF